MIRATQGGAEEMEDVRLLQSLGQVYRALECLCVRRMIDPEASTTDVGTQGLIERGDRGEHGRSVTDAVAVGSARPGGRMPEGLVQGLFQERRIAVESMEALASADRGLPQDPVGSRG